MGKEKQYCHNGGATRAQDAGYYSTEGGEVECDRKIESHKESLHRQGCKRLEQQNAWANCEGKD